MSQRGWRTAQLGDADVASTASGGTPDRSIPQNFGGGIPWVKSGELKDGLITSTEESLTSTGLEHSSARIFPRGTLLIALYGATAGKTGILGMDASTNQAVCAVFPKDNSFDSRFLKFQLIHLRPKILNARTGGAQPNISQRVLADLEISLPPLPEQRAIAHVLQTVQKAKEARQRELALERERKAALMEHLFTHSTRDEKTKQTNIGEIPEGWAVRKLEEVAELYSGGTPSKQRPDWWQGTIPWVSTKDLKKPRLFDVADHITEEAVREGSRLAPAKSLFVGVRGMILAKEIPVCLAEVPMAFNQDVKAVVPHEGISAHYLLYAINFFKSKLNSQVGTSAHGTRRISSDAVAKLNIPVPSNDEQGVIADALTACDERTIALQREQVFLDELFGATLEELMTGGLSALPLIEEHQPQ
jgi:type I restriction enzyme S subunit